MKSFLSSLFWLSFSKQRGCVALRAQTRSFSLIQNIPIVIRDVTDIAKNYDTFLLDQFGVLHNGVSAFPGAIEAVESLKAMNKTTIILSNSSQRSKIVSSKLSQMGFGSFSHIQTSGDSAHRFFSMIGKRVNICTTTWNDVNIRNAFFNDLNLEITCIEKADYLFFHGTESISTSMNGEITLMATNSLYERGEIDDRVQQILKTAIERNITAVCANLDLMARTPTGLAYMPGVLASEYERLGGTVISFGKPHAEFFDEALNLGASKSPLSLRAKNRVVHVGDSLAHDITGVFLFIPSNFIPYQYR